jgi:hypothetical protein
LIVGSEGNDLKNNENHEAALNAIESGLNQLGPITLSPQL